jgi:hypothetical protein
MVTYLLDQLPELKIESEALDFAASNERQEQALAVARLLLNRDRK